MRCLLLAAIAGLCELSALHIGQESNYRTADFFGVGTVRGNFLINEFCSSVKKPKLLKIGVGKKRYFPKVAASGPHVASGSAVNVRVSMNAARRIAYRPHVKERLVRSHPKERYCNSDVSPSPRLDVFNCEFRLLFEDVRFFSWGTVGKGSPQCNVDKVYGGKRIFVVSSKDNPQPTAADANLANVRPLKFYNTIAQNRGAVGGYYQILPIFSNHKGASVSHRAKDGSKENKLKYIRIEKLGQTVSGVFYESHRSALLVQDLDVDVSSDGKRWFHLVGPKCLQSLEWY